MNFGRDQAERYEQDLRDAIEIIADNPRIAAERHEYTSPVRVHHHAKHFIIYLIEDTRVLVVLRVQVGRFAVRRTRDLR